MLIDNLVDKAPVIHLVFHLF